MYSLLYPDSKDYNLNIVVSVGQGHSLADNELKLAPSPIRETRRRKPQEQIMKKTLSILAIAGLVLALATAAQAVTALTDANVTYDTGLNRMNILSIQFDGNDWGIDVPESLVVTTWDGTLYTKDTGTSDATLTSGVLSTADQNYVRYDDDLNVDTGWSFTNAESLVFDANLSSQQQTVINGSELDDVVLVLFESGNGDDATVQAYNGVTELGTALTLIDANWGDTGATSYAINNTVGQDSMAVGLSLEDLGVAAGTTVTKFVFTTVSGWDPTEILVPVPEPATMSLLAIGGLGLLLKRKRRRA
jgi:hypothetical protein